LLFTPGNAHATLPLPRPVQEGVHSTPPARVLAQAERDRTEPVTGGEVRHATPSQIEKTPRVR
jgi:hypothetical protein